MPQFAYKARDNDGLAFQGVVEADNELTVLSNLRSLGLRVFQIEKQGEIVKTMGDFIKHFRRIPQQEIILFTRQLAAMLRSGIPITSALLSISEQIKNEAFVKAIKEVLKDIEKGDSFSVALSKHPKIFNALFVNMVKVGEAAGILDEVLDRLVLLYSQELDVRMRIRAAMVYPLILVIAAIIIVSFLLTAIVPKFIAVFETYEARLPLATQILLFISNGIRNFGYIFLILIVSFVFWFKNYIKDEKGLYRFHTILLKLPIFGEFYLKVIVSRFTRILGVLVKSGVSILEALEVTRKTINNIVISKVIEKISLAVSEGQPLTVPFKASGIFPAMVVSMIAVGEKSGRIDQMLVDIASYYDQETEYAMKNATTILEPVLLLMMGGLVAFIALSVLLPIFNLIKVFRQGI